MAPHRKPFAEQPPAVAGLEQHGRSIPAEKWWYRSATADRWLYRTVRTRPRPVIVEGMCRNITELRGLEPSATDEEIEAAARQYVRKVSGIHSVTDRTREPFEEAVAAVTAITTRLLEALPDRKQPPVTVPPLRRESVKARIAAKAAAVG